MDPVSHILQNPIMQCRATLSEIKRLSRNRLIQKNITRREGSDQLRRRLRQNLQGIVDNGNGVGSVTLSL